MHNIIRIRWYIPFALITFLATSLLVGSCKQSALTPESGTKSMPTVTATVGPAKFSGFNLELSKGTYWEYGFDAGAFRVTLGDSTTIGGVIAYKILIAGDAGKFAPRWKYIASKDNRLLGSLDGVTLLVICDAQSGTWEGGGFFTTFPATTKLVLSEVNLSEGIKGNFPSGTSALVTGAGEGKPSSETIGGVTFYNDTSYSLTENEYYKGGIGPISYVRRSSSYVSGGNFEAGASSSSYEAVQLLATSLNAADGSKLKRSPWVWKSNIPGGTIEDFSTAVLNDKMYILGGRPSLLSIKYYDSVHIYEPSTDTWTTGKSMPFKTTDHTSQAVNGKIYVWGGNVEGTISSNSVDLLQVYNASANTWETKASISAKDFKDRLARSACVNGRMIVITNGEPDIFLVYDPFSDKWYKAPSLPIDNNISVGDITSVGSTVYAVGGMSYSWNPMQTHHYSLCWALQLDNGWTEKPPMSTKRFNVKTAVVDGKIYILDSDRADVDMYDPVTNTWTPKSPLPPAGVLRGAVAVNNKIYAFWGNAVFEYDPSKDN
jgi:N-acetylneuraminic acid mutarotase